MKFDKKPLIILANSENRPPILHGGLGSDRIRVCAYGVHRVHIPIVHELIVAVRRMAELDVHG